MVTYYGSSYHLSLKGTESLFPLLSFLPRSSHSSLSLSSPVLFEPFSLAPSGVVNVLVGPRFAGQAVKQKPKNSRFFFQKPYFFLFAEVLFRVVSFFFACESIKPFLPSTRHPLWFVQALVPHQITTLSKSTRVISSKQLLL